jgi:hypothetical protein
MNPLTGPVPSDWVKILQALPTDKYLATVVILVILASLLFGRGDHVKVRLPVFVLLCIVAVVLILGPDFIRAKNAPDIHASDQYTVLVHYAGVRRTTASSTVPFQASSGQINFGCGQSLPVTVNFSMPPGATLLSQSLGWVNVNNSNATSTSPVSVQGNIVAGAGVITGLNYQEFPFGVRNCPGGGHGALVLSGSYKVDQVSEQEIKGDLPQGKLTNVQHPVIFSLPSDPTLHFSNVSIQFDRTGKPESPDKIDMDLSTPLPVEKRSSDQKFVARLNTDLNLQVDFAQ